MSTSSPDVMWTIPPTDSLALPPPHHLANVLNQLQIALLPKTQRESLRLDPASKSEVVEPTLALYCPLEGGEYVIDATVKHLAEKAEAEVQVIDMAHLAAGQWGHFGKLAADIRFRKNPLGKVRPNEDLDDADSGDENVKALERFWREVLMMDRPANLDTPMATAEGTNEGEGSGTEAIDENTTITQPSPTRPRLVYIRDFGLLSSRVSTWFPPLYTALCERRLGDSTSPPAPSSVAHPTAIIFGFSPPISSLISNPSSDDGCQCDSCRPSAKKWDEGETKARAKRLKNLKEKWDRGTWAKELPGFKPTVTIPTPTAKVEEKSRGEYVVVDSETETKEDEQNESGESEDKKPESKSESETSEDDSSDSDGEDDSAHKQKLNGYFRSCIIAPAKRNAKVERAVRQARRKELNELMIRMTVGVKSGGVELGPAPVPAAAPKDEDETASEVKKRDDKDQDDDQAEAKDLMQGWDERLLDRNALEDVVESAMSMNLLLQKDGSEPETKTPVISWAQLQDAWREKQNFDEERKAWTLDDDDDKEDDDDPEKSDAEKPAVDEVVEKVKKAKDLDEYEQRLVGCIVDIVQIPTTFENVHLPAEVIDSIRSIVSLPLLYPEAFKSGILKQQAISGALLFGPPGTGKTHVVRALAKESGARMLAIKPSNIADKWVGETEKLVRALFKLARRLKPCVVFIDEIDSIMGSRMNSSCSGSSRWHTSMLTEFMQEMDGLIASSVIVIGATNRPFDIDDAVLRRLPCRLLVDLPGEKAREEILKIMLRDDELASDVTVGELARKTDRFSGSDLKNLCVAAAMDALKENIKLPWVTKQTATNATEATIPTAEPTTEPVAKAAEGDSSNTSSSSSEPNSKTSSTPLSETASDDNTKPKTETLKPRILAARHFARALMDIAPSLSESQGSLSELRKWNTQFGTGAQNPPTARPYSDPSYRNTGTRPYASSLTGMSGSNGQPSYESIGRGSGALGLGNPRAGELGSIGLGSSGFGFTGRSSTGLGSTALSSFSSGMGQTPSLSSGGLYGSYSSGLPADTRGFPGYNPSTSGGPSAPGN